MEWLALMGAILAWPFVTFITQYVKKKRNLSGSVSIALICLSIAVFYVAVSTQLSEATIQHAIALAGTTGTVAILLYNFLKPFISK